MSSQLPARLAGPRISSIGASHSSPAITLPRYDPNPTRTTPSSACRSRTSWPTFTMPSSAMSVTRASPMWVLCSQTMALASGPWWRIRRSRVSVMCRSRMFQDSGPPRTMAR